MAYRTTEFAHHGSLACPGSGFHFLSGTLSPSALKPGWYDPMNHSNMATQVTLVALYGKKKSELATFIVHCQKAVADAFGSAFTPYAVDQVHATIIGLERLSSSRFDNGNFARFRGRSVAMDFAGFLEYLRGCGGFPLEIQVGGFQDRDYPFTSRKSRPYERSFSIQGDKVVVMGWPVRGEPVSMSVLQSTPETLIQESRIYPMTLDMLRHGAQGFGILHGYHRGFTDVDNDLFFRLGLIDQESTSLGSTSSLEMRMREHMSQATPLIIEVALDDVFVAAYDDDTLPVARTNAWSVTDRRVDGKFISELYS